MILFRGSECICEGGNVLVSVGQRLVRVRVKRRKRNEVLFVAAFLGGVRSAAVSHRVADVLASASGTELLQHTAKHSAAERLGDSAERSMQPR
jgi:uncharacterized metal-binding protein